MATRTLRLVGVLAVAAVLGAACTVTPASGNWLDGTVPLTFSAAPAGFSPSQPNAVLYSGDTLEAVYSNEATRGLGLSRGGLYLFVWTGEIGVAGPVAVKSGELVVEVAIYPPECYDAGGYSAFALPWNTPVPTLSFVTTSLACP